MASRKLCRLAMVALCSAAVAYSQLSSGSVGGVVTDSAAALVIKANVRIVNAETDIARDTATDDTGRFSFPNLLPASYDLLVSAPGFKTTVRKGIQLQVDQGLRIDIQLEVGSVDQQIDVAAESPLLESESAKVGTVVETRQITELPLNGRQFAQLILLTPGALPIALGQSTSFKVQLGAGSYSPVVNGLNRPIVMPARV